MRRKLLALVLGGFSLACLAACSSPASDGKVTLIVYSPHGKELLSEFEKRFEIGRAHV